MYPRYPGSDRPEPEPPRPPTTVRAAVVLMIAGAAASLGAGITALLTRSSLRHALAQTHAHPTGSALTATVNAMTLMAVVLAIISVGLWLFVARGCQKGTKSARTTGTVLFGLDTLDLLIGPFGLHAAGVDATKILSGIVWLIGAATVALLWQRASTAFFHDETRRQQG
jgi:hypothetical protein